MREVWWVGEEGQYVLHSEFFLEAGYLILEFANEVLMVGEM